MDEWVYDDDFDEEGQYINVTRVAARIMRESLTLPGFYELWNELYPKKGEDKCN